MKTKFFTGVGDSGISNTGKLKIAKDDPIFMLLGSLDECTSWIGLASVTANEDNDFILIRKWLSVLQEMLFIAQAEVATVAFDYGKYSDAEHKFICIKTSHVKMCEEIIELIDKELPQLKNFVIPGGTTLSAQCDVTRTIARKAERYAVSISHKVTLSEELLAFLNRLSSVLFALARYSNFIKKIEVQSPRYTH